jgi:hypothetical protein
MYTYRTPTYLTAKPLAARWNMKAANVHRLKNEGKLPCYTLGAAIQFRLDDIEAYEAAGCHEAPTIPLQLRGRRGAG